MGNKTVCTETKSQSNKNHELINNKSFIYESIIGRGGFGKVWKVTYKKNCKQYAMKEMSKTKIIDKHSVNSVKSERDLLSKMNHPFIINMHFAFQDNTNIYLVMDLLTGGDLRYHLCFCRRFTEEQTKFFIACIILGLEYCHTNNIIHRDIKPENLVLDSKGYVKITDFGIAKFQTTNNHKETSGTPGYMAPEVMCAQDHTCAVDYFALGVIGYEFMKGVRPYVGKTRKEIKEKVMACQVQIKRNEIPKNWSYESVDFINQTLSRKPVQRLGYRGASEVKEHEWFNGFNWKDFYNRRITSPFIPRSEDNFDYKYCNRHEKIDVQTKEKYIAIMASDSYKNMFDDYYYFNRLDIESNVNTYKNIQMFKNPHLIYFEYPETNNNNIQTRGHIRNLSHVNENINDKIKQRTASAGVHRSSKSIDQNSNMNFCNANSYILRRNYMKRSMIENRYGAVGKNNDNN